MTIKPAYIEAVLFSAAKPMPLPVLADIFCLPSQQLQSELDAFGQLLEDKDRGLRLRISGAGVELVTAPACAPYLQKVRRKEDRLSSAALETLAVVAFKQPVTKSEVEELRGVNCEKVLKQLLSRNLIMELGHKDTVGRPTLYGTTDEFLRSVGIQSIDDLQASVEMEYTLGDGPTTLPQADDLFIDGESVSADDLPEEASVGQQEELVQEGPSEILAPEGERSDDTESGSTSSSQHVETTFVEEKE